MKCNTDCDRQVVARAIRHKTLTIIYPLSSTHCCRGTHCYIPNELTLVPKIKSRIPHQLTHYPPKCVRWGTRPVHITHKLDSPPTFVRTKKTRSVRWVCARQMSNNTLSTPSLCSSPKLSPHSLFNTQERNASVKRKKEVNARGLRNPSFP